MRQAEGQDASTIFFFPRNKKKKKSKEKRGRKNRGNKMEVEGWVGGW